MRVSIGLDLFEEGYKLNLCGLYLKLPVKARDPRDIMETWGVSYSDRALFLRWANKCKIIWMPWDLGSCVRREVINTKGYLEKESDYKWEDGKLIKSEDDRQEYTDTYTYTLKSGEIQNRIAKYYVGEMEWRWRIFHWLYKKGIKLGPKVVSRTISVTFNDEVGERTGSWKGGAMGCGYEMKPNELPYDCLRRMERERKF